MRGGRGALVLVGQGAAASGAVVVFALVTRRLPAHDFGLYVSVGAIAAIANAVIGIGLATRGLTQVASGAGGAVPIRPRVDGPALACASCLTFGAATMLGLDVVESAAAVLVFAAAVTGELALGLAAGREAYRAYAGLQFARSGTTAATTGSLLVALPPGDRLGGALLGLAAGCVVPMAYLAVTRGVRFTRGTVDGSRLGDLGTINLSSWLTSSADRLVLAHLAPAALPIYAATYGVLDRGFRLLTQAVVAAHLPRAVGGRERRLGARAHLIGTLAVTVVAVVSTPSAVAMLSGGRYRPGIGLTVLLCLGLGFMLAAASSYTTLLGGGRTRPLAVLSVAVAGVNLALNFVLAQRFGAMGAAVSTVVSYGLWLVGVTAVAWGARRSMPRPHRQVEALTR